MIKWISLLFDKSKKETDKKIEAYKKMSKGDLKKLVAKGEIKSIYYPYI
jgi:hypothetical protein